MRPLSQQGQAVVAELANRYGVSTDAVASLLYALVEGHGTMAQFDHPELGGLGQWSSGGMTMVGDMFNHALKAKVDGLCSELAALLTQHPGIIAAAPRQSQSQSQSTGSTRFRIGEGSLFAPAEEGGGDWWGADLGEPTTVGSQNAMRYAYFPLAHRLAIDVGGRVTVYDTADHRISGVSQQQSGDATLSFVSQRGQVRLSDLQVVTGGGSGPPHASDKSSPPAGPAAAPTVSPAATAPAASDACEEIFVKIERLAALREKNILSKEEFAAKKAELLSRL